MRKDFKYPIRIITRKEEIETRSAFGFLVVFTLCLPFLIFVKTINFLVEKGGKTILWMLWVGIWVIGSYLYFSS